MLPEAINSLLREKIDAYLRTTGFRPPTFGRRIAAKSFAGGTIQPYKLGPAIAEEIDSVSNGIFESMKHVLDKISIAPYDDLQRDLLDLFDSEFDACAGLIRSVGEDYLRKASSSPTIVTQSLNDKVRDAKSARHTELKIIAAMIMQQPERQNGNVTLTIQNAQIGVLQTGEGSSVSGANIVFTSAEVSKLANAMDDLRARIDRLDLPPTKRDELMEVAVDIKAEIAKPVPNQTKLGGLLSMLSASIKGASTLADIYNVIEVSLKLLGITFLS